MEPTSSSLGMGTIVSSSWATERLHIADAVLSDAPDLMSIFNACAYVEPWDPTFKVYPLEEFTWLVDKSVASTPADTRPFRLQLMRARSNGSLVGYYHMLYRPRDPDEVFISMFVIHPEYQGQKLGQEAAGGLWKEVARLGVYNHVRLNVYLTNWPALRFWISQGFTKIINYDGDSVFKEGAHADLLLERPIP